MSAELVVFVDRLFDGHELREEPLRIEVRDGAFHSVRLRVDDEPVPAHFVDARGATLLPGLIDAHCHVARVGLFEAHESPSPGAVAHNLRRALESGVTTAGDMGCPGPMIAALRAHTEAETASGPAIRSSGPLLTAPLGYPLDWMSPAHVWLGAAVPCGDQRSARRAVQRLAEAGMDHVKICIMHRGYDLDPLPVFSKAVAESIVAEAHALGLRVLAHAHWNADYRVALAAGVDALMHSSFDPLDDELVARVRDAGVSVCPTLWVFHSACLGAGRQLDRDPERLRGVVPAVRRSWRRFADAYAVSGDVMPAGIAGGLPKQAALDGVRNAVANLILLRDAGVPLAHGSDGPYGYSQLGRPLDELVTLRDAGLSPLECLRAATCRAADLLGASDRGVVAPGRRADFVLVRGNPVADLSALQRVEAVYRAGQRVSARSAALRGTARAAVSGIAATLRDALGGLSARWLDG